MLLGRSPEILILLVIAGQGYDHHGHGFLGFHPCHQSHRDHPQRIRTLPEIDGLSKDTVLTSWMAKYDAITKGEIVSHLMSYLAIGHGQVRCHGQRVKHTEHQNQYFNIF